MGMDGLSMANTGALKESTSADYATRTEQAMQADKTNDPKQIQTLSTNRRVREKEEEEEAPKRQAEQEAEEEEFDDGLVENPEDSTDEEFEDGLVEEPELEEEFDIQELENPNKDFYVKLNAKDDIIELYDSSSQRLIETISGNELQGLVSKLNMASGIFINKRV